MTKDDWIWVAIRIFGIYLVVLAITSVPGIVNSALMTSAFWNTLHVQKSSQALRVTPSDVTRQLESEGKAIPKEEVASALSGFEAMDRFSGEVSAKMFQSSLSALVSGCFRAPNKMSLSNGDSRSRCDLE
jgi:hypothetical protein